MSGLRDGCERAWGWSMVNGNFWKAATFIAMVGLGILTILAQSNFGRLEERIIALQTQLSIASEANSAGLAAVAQRHEDLREKFNDLNAQVRSLPSQMVTQAKALEQTRAQVNTILYQVLGVERQRRSQQICIDGEC